MTLAVFEKHVWVPTLTLCGSSGCGGRGGVGGLYVWGDDREASGSRNGWTETETVREKERVMQLLALVKGKVTLCVTSSLSAATLVTMETQLMNTCTKNIAANHSTSVQKVHAVYLCLQTMLSVSLHPSPLLGFLTLSSSLSLTHSVFFCV